jgi:hypothetical protein
VDYEQPLRRGNWSTKSLKKWTEGCVDARISGCAYEMREPITKKLVEKNWLITSTDRSSPAAMERTCSNRRCDRTHHHEHDTIQGKLTERSAAYPPQMR